VFKGFGKSKTEFIFVSDIVILSFEIYRPMYSTIGWYTIKTVVNVKNDTLNYEFVS
jgi:hypothetical protein